MDLIGNVFDLREIILKTETMKIKYLIIVCSAVLFSKVLSAQTYIQGGVNFANISVYSNGKTEKNNSLTTFNAGILSRFGLSKLVDLESGLIFTGRGSKAETYYTNNDYVKTKFNPYYLELPLNLVVKIPVPGGLNLFAHAGPYIAMGIAGKSTSEYQFAGIAGSSSNDIKYSNENPFTSQQENASYDKLKRFDFGLNFGAGVDLKKIILKANYGLGLTKINSTQSNNGADDQNKYRTFSLSVGIPISR